MDYPIDRIAFSKFIRHSNIFELTRVAMAQCLESWYNDEREQFLDDMRADFDAVMENTTFMTGWYHSTKTLSLSHH